MPKITVIVPVFNLEMYVNRCIDSVAKQTFSDFECILVDDCSIDRSSEICDEIVEKDNRFSVIHKIKNEGLPKARKSGIDAAKGEFIVQVDGDDLIELNTLELFMEKQKQTNADIVMAGFRTISPYNNISEYLYPNISKDISPLEYFFYAKCRTCCAKLVKKKLYENINVSPYSIGEDAILNVQIFSKLSDISQISIVNSIVYNYDRRNENSLTRTTDYSYKNYEDDPRIRCRLFIEDYLKKKNVDKKEFDAFRFYMIEEGIISYLRFNKQISNKEAKMFYKEYFIPFSQKEKLTLYDRNLLKIFNISVALGRSYLFVRSILGKIKYLVRGIKF